MFIVEWWNSLSIASQAFACTAIPATLILIIQTILMLIGIGNDSDGLGDDIAEDIPDDLPDDIPDDVPDADGVFGDNGLSDTADTEGFDGLRVFTVRGIVAFFVVFGWVGLAMDATGVALPITIAVSIISGAAMMLVLAVMLRAVMKLRNDGNTDNRNAIGKSGKVHLTVPARRAGEGKVHVMLQGAYVERGAVTDEEEPIPTGAEVVVVGVSGDTDLVVRRK